MEALVYKIKCTWCKGRFNRAKKEVARSKLLGRRLYCSGSCAAQHKAYEQPLGTSRAATRRLARAIYIERNGCKPCCRICNKKADVHHKNGNEFDNSRKNQDPLCRSHHISLENYKRVRRISVKK